MPTKNRDSSSRGAAAENRRVARLSRAEDIGAALTGLNAFLIDQNIDDRRAHRAIVVVEELVVNAFTHGGAEDAGGVAFELVVKRAVLRGSIWYEGPAFDPSAPLPEADDEPPAAADEPIAGRGLRLIQAFASSLVYARDGETNHVAFEIASG